MTKRDIKETVREYDGAGKLIRETITETHEEDYNTLTTTTTNWWEVNRDTAVPQEFLYNITCDNSTEGTTVLS